MQRNRKKWSIVKKNKVVTINQSQVGPNVGLRVENNLVSRAQIPFQAAIINMWKWVKKIFKGQRGLNEWIDRKSQQLNGNDKKEPKKKTRN